MNYEITNYDFDKCMKLLNERRINFTVEFLGQDFIILTTKFSIPELEKYIIK